jgi:hypothetical protein
MTNKTILLIGNDEQMINRALTALASLQIKTEVLIISNTKEDPKKGQTVFLSDDIVNYQVLHSLILTNETQSLQFNPIEIEAESLSELKKRKFLLSSGKVKSYFKNKENYFKKNFSRIRRSTKD